MEISSLERARCCSPSLRFLRPLAPVRLCVVAFRMPIPEIAQCCVPCGIIVPLAQADTLFRRSHSAWQIDPGPYPCHVGCSRFGRAKLSQTETQYLEACVRAAGKWQQSGNKSGTMVPLLFPLMRNSGRSGNKAETKAATRFQFICLHFLGGGRLVRHTTQVEIECVRR